MKKIAIIFSVITIFVCGWIIIDKLDSLDIASNKNDTYLSIQKEQIDKRTDIDRCEKEIKKNILDNERKNFRNKSEIAYQTQLFSALIIILQIFLIIFLLLYKTKK